MANPTTNYGWQMPTPTDLVTDLPADFEVFGQAADGTVFANAALAVNKTIVDAKGDLIAATAADAVARLSVGANNTVLTADSAEATGMKWAAAAAGGKLLQVVQANITTTATIATLTQTDTNITATITPTLSSSKILVIISGLWYIARNSGVRKANARIVRGSTTIQSYLDNTFIYYSATDAGGITTIQYLDSPATTSATTYKLQSALADTTADAHTIYYQVNSGTSTITLLEIGA